MNEILQTALEASRAACEVLRSHFGRVGLGVEAKSVNDFVTEADHASEAAILKVLNERHPEHSVLSEEAGWSGLDGAEYVWVVDPLDGTTNFLHGLPVWAVSIACLKNRQPVVGVIVEPMMEKTFSAVAGSGAFCDGRPIHVSDRDGLDGAFLATGFPFKAKDALELYLRGFASVFRHARAVRRTGAAALDLAYTATGTYDGFFEFRLSPWDLAAGQVILLEAGGRITNLDGEADILSRGSVIAGAPGTWAGLLEVMDELGGEATLEELLQGKPSTNTSH